MIKHKTDGIIILYSCRIGYGFKKFETIDDEDWDYILE